jgi:8-oxo-dGTP pyrophosphatase MutT (NUDIX family)/nucleoside diphosphate kinase
MEERGLTTVLLDKLKDNNLEIVYQGLVQFNLELVRLFYQWDVVIYPKEIGEYLCTRVIAFLVVRGKDAISKASEIKQELRRDFGNNDPLLNLMHCSDSPEEFKYEYLFILNQQIQGRKSMPEIKTNNQVEVILFKRYKDETLFLILKRNPQRGGFWQPITGNVKIHEAFKQAALREMEEETGIKEYLEFVDTGYSFDFFDDNRDQHEKVFGVRIPETAEIVLSHEHTAFQWATKEDALNRYLKYPGNKKGLKKLCEKLGI